MTAATKSRKWTVEEFFAWHEQQEERYELIAGFPVLKRPPVPVMLPGATAPTMMTGASRRHNEVSAELISTFRNLLRGKPCRAYTNEAAVRTSGDQIRYPDLVVDCGTRADAGYIFEHPVLIAEVLSPSTRSFDLAGKLTEYWQIASVSYILIVDPDQRRAQLHTRHVDRLQTLQTFDYQEDVIEIPELGLTLKLADIFAGLASEPEA